MTSPFDSSDGQIQIIHDMIKIMIELQWVIWTGIRAYYMPEHLAETPKIRFLQVSF